MLERSRRRKRPLNECTLRQRDESRCAPLRAVSAGESVHQREEKGGGAWWERCLRVDEGIEAALCE